MGDLALAAAAGGRAAAPVQASFTRLTDQEGRETFPSLSPDGDFFVYAKATAPGNLDLYLQRVGGGNPINLTADSPVDDTQPAFSPDGQQIAFRSERDGGGIFVMGATGESVRRLTDFGYNPAWSPDGREIVVATEGVSDPGVRHADQPALAGRPGDRREAPARPRATPCSRAGRRTARASPTGACPPAAPSGRSGRCPRTAAIPCR